MNTKDLAKIIELFDASTLSELSIQEEALSLTLRREMTAPAAPQQPMHVHYQQPVMAAPAPAQTPAAPAAPAAPTQEPAAAAPAAPKKDTIIIKSPIVGTFYRTPAPDAPPFVEVGVKAKKGASLCIIEAMKLMNRLEAEFDCTIVDILVDHGTFVEFDTPLFEVRKI